MTSLAVNITSHDCKAHHAFMQMLISWTLHSCYEGKVNKFTAGM